MLHTILHTVSIGSDMDDIVRTIEQEIEAVQTEYGQRLAVLFQRLAMVQVGSGREPFGLSLSDAARYVGLKPRAMRDRLASGAFVIGCHYRDVGTVERSLYRFDAAALDEWLKLHPEERGAA